MGSDCGYYWKPGPCPVCGKGTAYLGSSRWCIDFSVCSEACGQAAHEAVNAVRESKAYRKLTSRIVDLRSRQCDLESEAIEALSRDMEPARHPTTGESDE